MGFTLLPLGTPLSRRINLESSQITRLNQSTSWMKVYCWSQLPTQRSECCSPNDSTAPNPNNPSNLTKSTFANSHHFNTHVTLEDRGLVSKWPLNWSSTQDLTNSHKSHCLALRLVRQSQFTTTISYT